MSEEETFEALFRTFKESIEDLNEDKEYFEKKMEIFNEVGEALNEYMKELNEMNVPGMGSQESVDLTKITNTQIEAINKFEKQIPLMGKTIKGANITNKSKKKEVLNYLKALKKDIKNKKVDIKIANPSLASIKLTPLQKLKYLKRRNA